MYVYVRTTRGVKKEIDLLCDFYRKVENMKVKVIECLLRNLEMALQDWLRDEGHKIKIERTETIFRNPNKPVDDGHISYVIYYT